MAAPQYATVAELTAYLAADDLLAQASRLIDSVLIGVVYDTDENGFATDPVKKEAIKRATMAQAAFWKAGYGSPYGTPTYSSVAIGSVTLSGAGSGGKGGDSRKTVIAPQALYELESAGLRFISAKVVG